MHEEGLNVCLRQSAPIALDAELSCARGELLALVGPSGSGKTSILRSIAGLMEAKEGRIVCDGAVWFDSHGDVNLTPQHRRVGVVFQHFALFPHLSALENIMEAMLEIPRPQRKLRAQDWLNRLHLQGLESRKSAQLSGGQQQRVALARALAREPRALLLDEPFSAVDRTTRETLFEELAGLRRELSMPVVLVTHDLDEALLLADRMTILAQGKTLQSGAPFDVVTRPDTMEVARLVGQKNLFRAGIVEHLPELGITIIEWRKRRLQARLQTEFAPRSQVTWTIPRSHLVLPSAGQPPRGGNVNKVRGRISALIRLGETAALSVDVDGAGRPPVFISVPLHMALDDRLSAGMDIDFSFLPEGIHLMPAGRSAAGTIREISEG
ncbi:MAG: hypothetical protein A3H35_08845 [Betaproteobacteria bacterium RIFCSPLOWO2_02_FULL_62_17]|nr:MAG: hypothetical protein A3H35_08845 [Betaproteobacteria bacterium RIFCSPLOWO2_02_FULL_62_17]